MGREQEMRSNQRELREALDRRCWFRAFISALILTVLIPIFLIVVHANGMYGVHNSSIKALLICTEVFQVLSAIAGFLLISGDETDKLKIFYRFYFYITQLLMIFVARAELAYEGSVFAYGVVEVYGVMLPVFVGMERNIFYGMSAFLSFVTAASAVGMGRSIVEVAMIAAGSFVLGKYISDKNISHENLALRLKAKTITSEKDPLTSLTNRRGVDKKISMIWNDCVREEVELSAIEIDIDFFKKYNDKFGHPAGDRCLKQIASAIKSATDGMAEVTARIGGEEFLVIFRGSNPENTIDVAMRIRKRIDELKLNHACVHVSQYVTVSMGVAHIVPNEYNSFEELYKKVDDALYSAKSNGRNCIVCDNKIYGRMKKGLATVISM